MGHPTFAYVRPIQSNISDHSSKLNFLKEFQSMGVVTFIQVNYVLYTYIPSMHSHVLVCMLLDEINQFH